jgi:feruloyl esterase
VISDWVEHDKPPERIVATKFSDGGEVLRTRPLCVYPQRAAYLGTGSTDNEANFACRQPYRRLRSSGNAFAVIATTGMS